MAGYPAAIDLRSLPMSPQDRIELERVLGEGEVQATVKARWSLERSGKRGVSGIWWVSIAIPRANRSRSCWK